MRNLRNKKGVSLIAVLLFMMIATIAATATFKWLTSEGFSSASRLVRKEAEQNAIAGLESARSWMTYHANDVGALIKQYYDNDKKPIRLDTLLQKNVRARQYFNVWLAGVDASESSYKLKIISQGSVKESDNANVSKATYNVTGIFNVDGLYKVEIPSYSASTSASVDFKEAFFGSAKEGISIDVTTAIINGNTTFNTNFEASEYVIVTGDVSVNSKTNVGDLYVKGSLNSCTNFNVSGDAYIEEELYANGTQYYAGNLYVGKGVDFSGTGTSKAQCSTGSGGGFTVEKNMTTHGDIKMPRHTAATQYIVKGDVVLADEAKINFPTHAEFNAVGSIPWQVHFYGNVYLDGGLNNGWHIGYARAPYFSLGSNGKKVYSATPIYRISDNNAQLLASYKHWTNNYVTNNGAGKIKYRNTSGNYSTYSGLAANTYCNSEECAPTYDFSGGYFWSNAAFYAEWETQWSILGGWNTYPKGCQQHYSWWTHESYWACNITSSQLKRNEIFLQVNGTYTNSKPDTTGWLASRLQSYEDKITTESSDGCGSNAHVEDPIQFNKSLLNNSLLHSGANKQNCTNLTIFNAWPNNPWEQLSNCYETEKAAGKLYNDNWLLVKVDDPQWATINSNYLQGNFILIVDYKSNAANFVLPTTKAQANGSSSNVIIYFPNGYGSIIRSAGTGDMNYFLFSDGDLSNLQLVDSKINGSIFLSDCHNMGSSNTIRINYNETLTEALAGAAIICNNDKTGTCSTSSNTTTGSSSSTSSSTGTNNSDAYYIANAAQLSISLESKYRSTEDISSFTPSSENSQNPEESFIVLPRIIYLTIDAYGKLTDYYSAIRLNANSSDSVKGSVESCSCYAGDCLTNDESTTSIPTSGLLYDRKSSSKKIAKGYYTCKFSSTDNSFNESSQDFYVVVDGESGDTPNYVKFTESSVDMGSSATHEVKLDVPAHSNSIIVTVTKPGDINGWSFVPASTGTCEGTTCTFTLGANSDHSETTVFTVTTTNVTSGTAVFTLKSGEGYVVGSPNTEVLQVAANATIKRKDVSTTELEEFCNKNSVCPENITSWPNCPTSESWVKAVSNCNTTTTNEQWECGVTEDISLQRTNQPDNCVIIIPDVVLSQNSLQIGSDYELPASIKATKKTFYFGFSGNNLSGTTIKATVTSSTAADRVGLYKTCTFGNDITDTKETCTLSVFNGEYVEVSFEDAVPSSFNYWECSGIDCPAEVSSSDAYSSFIITADGNKIIAHFNETDKHCFFDEFNTGINCSSAYCISSNSEKWRTEGASKLDYQHGYVAYKQEKSTDKTGVTVMSTAEAGLNGTLKAQFQVPRVAKSTQSSLASSIRNSGFIFRSNESGTNYLLLNIYADAYGYLTAMICDNSLTSCDTKTFTSSSSKLEISSTTVVTLTADITEDAISLSAITDRLGASSTYTAAFDWDNFTSYRHAGKYMGFRLADPAFKLYDIGWKSTDYGAECWDTYPTVNCSFKSAYAGGALPKDESVTPWVGLSSWFDSKNCEAHYYYNGDDSNCGYTSGSYVECFDSYKFSKTGAHGYNDSDGKEIMTAKAGVGNCSTSDVNDMLLAATERAHCGAFWVGELSYCKQNVYFAGSNAAISAKDIAGSAFYSFNLSANEFVNVREATLNVEVINENHSEIEIYLLSATDAYSNPYYSKSFITYETGTIAIDIESILEEDGFDPQSVYGVVVQNLGSDVITVQNIYTVCPNVISLTCSQSVTYNSDTKKWDLTALVTNYSEVKSFTVSEKSSFTSKKEYICENSGCTYTESGKSATYAFSIEDNPYQSHTEDTYQFKVALSTKDGSSLTCTTNSVEIPSVQGVCGSLSSTVISTGKGLPKFTYAVMGCPTADCSYKISLNDGTAIYEGSGNTSNGSTSSQAANTATAPLEAGTYKFKLESTSESTPFTSCESVEFRIKNDDELNVDCAISTHSWEVYGSEFYDTDDLYFVAISDSNNLKVTVQQDGNSIGTAAISAYSYTSTKDIGKLSPGYYSFSLVNNNTEVCSANITVLSKSDASNITCGVSSHNNEIYGGNTFYTTENLYFLAKNSNENIELTNITLNRNDQNIGTITIPAYWWYQTEIGNLSSGTYTYSLYSGSSLKCSHTVTVSNPTANCSVSNTSVTSGSTITYNVNNIAPSGTHVNFEVLHNGTTVTYSNDYWTDNSYSNNITLDNEGEHTFVLKINGNEVCSNTVNVVELSSSSIESSSSVSGDIDGTLCVNNSNDIYANIEPGNYYFMHSCKTYEWRFICSGSAGIDIAGTHYDCDGSEKNSWNVLSGISIPASGSVVVVPEGSSISKISCTLQSSNALSCTQGFSKNSGSSGTESSSGDGGGKTVTYGSYQSFTPGFTYTVTINSEGGSMFRCITGSSSSSARFIGTFNGSSLQFDGWQTQATITKPSNGSTVTFVVDANAPSDLQCATDW